MKIVHEQAVAGDAESQYQAGLYLFKSGDADTTAVEIGALVMSAKQGHSGFLGIREKRMAELSVTESRSALFDKKEVFSWMRNQKFLRC